MNFELRGSIIPKLQGEQVKFNLIGMYKCIIKKTRRSPAGNEQACTEHRRSDVLKIPALTKSIQYTLFELNITLYKKLLLLPRINHNTLGEEIVYKQFSLTHKLREKTKR